MTEAREKQTRQLAERISRLQLSREEFEKLADAAQVSPVTLERVVDGVTTKMQLGTLELAVKAVNKLENTQTFERVKQLSNAVNTNDLPAQEAAVLFSDLVGSTAFKMYHGMTEAMEKAVIHNKLATECVSGNDGQTIKFLGDGLMAVFFGIDCARRAIDTALSIIAQIDEENDRRTWHLEKAMCTRIGVAAGKVCILRYTDSGADDVLGTTVDLAARLCGLGGAGQLICDDATFEQAGGEERFPNCSPKTMRFVKGLLQPVDIRAVVPPGRRCGEIPAGGHMRPIRDSVRPLLDRAAALMRDGKYEDALTVYEQVLAEDGGNFEANFRLGELRMALSRSSNDPREVMESVVKHFETAMLVRPQSSRVWLMLSFAYFKEFELVGDESKLTKAIESASVAIERATEFMDLNGVVEAKSLLARLLLARYERSKAADDIAQASQLCHEVSSAVDGALSRSRSNYLVTDALVRLAQGDVDYDRVRQMIEEAMHLDPRNPQVHLVNYKLAEAQNQEPGAQITPF